MTKNVFIHSILMFCFVQILWMSTLQRMFYDASTSLSAINLLVPLKPILDGMTEPTRGWLGSHTL